MEEVAQKADKEERGREHACMCTKSFASMMRVGLIISS